MMQVLRTRVGVGLIGLLLCLPLPATAENYAVEIVIFSSLHSDDGEEQWPLPASFPASDQALALGEGGTRTTDGARSLQAIADSLGRSNAYRPLLHWRWVQPGLARAQARPVRVQVPAGSALPLKQPAAGMSSPRSSSELQRLYASPGQSANLSLLDGTVSLTLARYLHLAVDLIFTDPATGVPVRLKESRRMRSNELHYLDHPRFGVLVQVTPVKPAAGN
ncbi:MAG: CsiV family protein [Gammaproteobacteria bacterium]